MGGGWEGVLRHTGVEKNAQRILFGNPELKNPLRRISCKMEGDIETGDERNAF